MSHPSVKESKKRSIYKGLTWRFLATATTFLLAWLFAKDLSVATTIAPAEFFIKFAIYYLHERAWQRVPFSSNKINARNHQPASNFKLKPSN